MLLEAPESVNEAGEMVLASWVVSGVEPVLRNGVVHLLDSEKRSKATFRAPRAMDQAGDVEIQTKVDGQVIAVVSRTLIRDGPLLVDPIWMTTAPMYTPREFQTASLLPFGMVLVVGGLGGPTSAPLASAELFNPETGTWIPVADLHTARAQHTATLLLDGRVLVVGGVGGTGGLPRVDLASAEIFDPLSGAWTSVAPMHAARRSHSATLLANGRVLVCGGLGNDGRSCELFDPLTSTWTFATAMTTVRWSAAAERLVDGRVLMAGGAIGSGSLQATAELYSPLLNQWSPAAPMATARAGATSALLENGKVLVVGGDDNGLPGPPEIYDPGTNTWSPTGPMPLHSVQLAQLHDGRVLAAGGLPMRETALYDPVSNAWNVGPRTNNPMYAGTATTLLRGDVLLTGGQFNEVFDPTLGVLCADPSSCLSGHCVGHVCCDAACSGGCGACNTPGALGVCSPVPRGSVGVPSCAPYACNGENLTCPASCLSVRDCPIGQYCVAGGCVPQLSLATNCSNDDQCLTGHCSDGVCCSTACSGSCDVCNRPGGVGTCLPADAGARGAPACQENFCNGIDVRCVLGCSVDAECVLGHCVDGFCCNQACDDGCTICNYSFTPGVCSLVRDGDPGRGRCGAYVCYYQQKDCPTSCIGDHMCAVGHVCDGGTCVPCVGCLPDAGVVDAGVVDAGVVDAGVVDAGVVDAGVVDAGVVDAGVVDAGVVDAGVVDAGVVDAGVVDAGAADAGGEDPGMLDGGSTDAGVAPTGPHQECGCGAGALPSASGFLALAWMMRRRSRLKGSWGRGRRGTV
ncbi:MAG: hypothetical protein K1X89_18005 [Myxococcaceae bacterium]|nr:hypothetical protein [Myxococcaceae bacterium]